ncbi:MAG: GAF domain-containing protein [Flavobacteriaceae bacterium]|nr:GAF domain-containing protein [Flavobacteriaceae bacterium]
MTNSNIFIGIFLFIGLHLAVAQNYQYTNYQDDEVPFKKVNQAIQDSFDFMWFATDRGLYRFDGLQFEDFNTNLKSKHIKSIISWQKDTLLFSNDTGIFKLFYVDQQPTIQQTYSTDNHPEYTYPDNLFKDSKDRLWVSQPDGSVLLITKRSKKKYQILQNTKSPEIHFAEDGFGNIWALMNGNGLFHFDEKNQQFKSFRAYNSLQDFYIQEDTILLAGEEFLILKVNQGKELISERLVNSNNGPFNCIEKSRDDTFFIGSEQGLYSFKNEKSSVLKKVFGSNDPHRIEELPYTNIQHIYFTADQVKKGGKIWICTDTGVGLLYSSYFQNVSGMTHDNVFSMGVTSENEILISQSTIAKIRQSKGEFEFEDLENIARVTGISSYNKETLLGTSDGSIWLDNGTTLSKKYDFSGRGGGIFFMQADSRGNHWFCQAPTEKPIVGVAKIDTNGKTKLYDQKNGLKSRVLVVKEGGKNELYAAGIGLDSYLYKYNSKRDSFENKSSAFPFKVSSNFEVHDIAVDALGLVWMATTDGLLKYDTERVERIDLGDHTKNEIRSVAVMPDRSLWMATDTNGLIYLGTDGEYVQFDESSGLPSKVASYRSLLLDKNNRIWAGTAEGAIYSSQVSPKPLQTKSPNLTSLIINTKKKTIGNGIEFSETDDVRLNFTTIDFPGNDIKYQFKIAETALQKDELETLQWNTTTTNEIRIKGLKTGQYTLFVRSQKPGGHDWSQPLMIQIKSLKKWYKTTIGIVMLLLSFLLFFWYVIRRWFLSKTQTLKNRLLQKERELDKKEDELKSAGSNIYLLFRLLKQIPKEATWQQIWPILKKLIELPTGIDAFDIASKKGEELRYKRYIRGQEEFVEHVDEFNEKNNLASYALVSNAPIHINNFNKEVSKFISGKDHEGYLSRIIIPFQLKKGEVVLSVYGKDEGRFTQRDLTLLQILTEHLSSTITNKTL